MKQKEMFDAVKKENVLSYSPYSKYRVSAACLLKDGRIITGINIENSSYGLSICAERCTLFRVYAEGYKRDDIVSLMIYTNRLDSMPYPCGACRQVMSELMPMDAKVYIVNDQEMEEEYTVSSLIPHCFTPDNL